MPANRSLLRTWRARLTLDPLDPADPDEDRYVPIHEAGTGAVDDIFSLLDLALEPTTQLLSGPSGSGKTTELKRLSGRLREAGFTVVLTDILGYVNQSSQIDVTEFLIAVALAFEDGLLPGLEKSAQERWSARFNDFLKRIKVSIGTGPASVSLSGEGVTLAAPGMSLEVNLQKEVKKSEPFVADLRTKLAFHLGELQEEVAAFCTESVGRHRERNPDSAGVVMIVDSLEKVRGTTENDAEVQASVERLLVHHSDKLRFSSHHMVYTVPPYLMFTDPGMLPYDGAVRPVPIPHVRTPEREESPDNVRDLVNVVARRIPWQELLGSQELLRDVVLASGGHLRDLFTILQELIMLVNGRGTPLPAAKDLVDEAIDKVALGFSSITEQDAVFLRHVDQMRGAITPREEDVGRLARLLHTHMVLGHRNGGGWYEVHPLARPALGLLDP